MSNPWMPIATRGAFDARIFTRARLLEDNAGAASFVAHPYLVIITPHGSEEGDSTPVWFTSLDSLAAWVVEMHPKALYAHTAGTDAGEDCDELLAFLRRGGKTN